MEKKITLPSREAMEDRLLRVCPTSAHLREHFFPALMEHAGEKMRPGEVAGLFHRALVESFSATSLQAKQLALDLLPTFVRALVRDRELAEEVAGRVLRMFGQRPPR